MASQSGSRPIRGRVSRKQDRRAGAPSHHRRRPQGDRCRDRRRWRKLLAAIAELAALSPSTDLPHSVRPLRPKTAEVSAERRPITVMFCDLVGSTGLAAKLDAEDWRNLVNAYLDEASEAVTGFGGHVLKKLGDGLMALFGYPQAQENDAERAVRAALAIQRALAELNARNAAHGRAGAFRPHRPRVRPRRGRRRPARCSAKRRTLRRACRPRPSQGRCWSPRTCSGRSPGCSSSRTRARTSSRASPSPVSLYRIVRASGGGRRGGARALTPFVGREEELDAAARRWERARAGEGQFVLIVGEPGLGKSRLVEEFRGRLGETPHTWVEWARRSSCRTRPCIRSPNGAARGSAVRTLRAESGSPTSRRRSRRSSSTPRRTRPCSRRCSTFRCPRTARREFAPEELRRRQLAAMVAWVLAGARTQPVVLAFEDLHWADPTSLDLMQALAERGAQAPLLIVATARPEFRAPWGMRSHHSVISLAPLDRRRFGAWSARSPRGMPLRKTLSRASASAPAACRCSSRR